MKGVDKDGREVSKEKPRNGDRAIVGASDQEIRGILGRFLVSKGLTPSRASKLIRRSRGQFYRDLKAGDTLIQELLHGPQIQS